MSALVSDRDVHTNNYSTKCLSIKLLLIWMTQTGLWPLSHALSSRTIFGLVSKLTEYTTTVQYTPALYVCPSCRDWIADEFRKLAYVMGSSTSGLCLDCFKRGGSEKRGHDCRIKHV